MAIDIAAVDEVEKQQYDIVGVMRTCRQLIISVQRVDVARTPGNAPTTMRGDRCRRLRRSTWCSDDSNG